MAATRSKTASETKRGYQEGDETLVSLKFVKELLEQQQSTMKTFISAFMDSVNVRVDSLKWYYDQNFASPFLFSF